MFLNLYLNYIRPKVISSLAMDELKRQTRENKEKVKMEQTWGPNNVRSPGLNSQRHKELLLDTSKNPFEI